MAKSKFLLKTKKIKVVSEGQKHLRKSPPQANIILKNFPKIKLCYFKNKNLTFCNVFYAKNLINFNYFK